MKSHVLKSVPIFLAYECKCSGKIFDSCYNPYCPTNSWSSYSSQNTLTFWILWAFPCIHVDE